METPEVESRSLGGYAVGLAAIGVMIVYSLSRTIYNLFFHPLAKYPGPKIAAITDLWYAFSWTSGRWPFIIEQVHKKYGNVVRTAPNELSFCTVQSYKDIYGHASKGRSPFLKSAWYESADQPAGVATTRDPADHSRQRKSLSSAFSTKSLRGQEDIVQQYVDLFVEQMGRLGAPDTQGVNMCEAFNWLTFDIIGDLAFGESFGAVATGKTNYWVSIILDGTWWSTLVGLRKRVPLMNLILPFILPKNISKDYQVHKSLTREKTEKRIKQKDSITRPDFFDQILKKGEYTQALLENQANTLIVAGSETTATFLAGATYFLLKNPDCLAKLQREVCDTFKSLDEITGEATSRLEYLNAVIEEGLRLYPPAAFGLPRVSPGAHVDGHYVPAGISVSTDTWTVMHDSRYWHDAEKFQPERWIEGSFHDTKEAFQPFSLGPRACLGINLAYLEARVIMAKMVWQYEWELVSKDVDWYRDCRMYLLWKKPVLRVRFHPRVIV